MPPVEHRTRALVPQLKPLEAAAFTAAVPRVEDLCERMLKALGLGQDDAQCWILIQPPPPLDGSQNPSIAASLQQKPLYPISSSSAAPPPEIGIQLQVEILESGDSKQLPLGQESAMQIVPLKLAQGGGLFVLAVQESWLNEPEHLALLEAVVTGAREKLVSQRGDAFLAELEAMLNHPQHGIALIHDDGSLLLLSSEGAKLLQVDAKQALGRSVWELMGENCDPALRMSLRSLQQGAKRVTGDVSVRRGGKNLILALEGHRLSSRLPGALIWFRDVTKNRSKEQEWRQASTFLERLVDSSSDAIVAADTQGKLLVFNRAAEELFGIPHHEVKNTHVSQLYPEGGAQEIMRLLRESPHGKIDAVRIYGRSQAGDLFPMEVSANLLKEDGREQATVGLLRDMRERVRVENELARARERLLEGEKQRVITALAGAAAHELNQPLTVILGSVELLRRRLSPEHEQILGSITTEADKMAGIVRRISRLSRIETMPYVGQSEIADLKRSSEEPEEPEEC